MITYQDLLAVGESDAARMDFVRRVINEHKSSELYKTAEIADAYARRQNYTIKQYQKLLYTVTGRAVPDNYSANFKLISNFFDRFVTQENQTLLANGVTWGDKQTDARLGAGFDNVLSLIGKYALVQGVCFGFYNLDHVELFPIFERSVPCFAPIYDEENGALTAGVRFWQLDGNKPLRAVLYEPDGYTAYMWADGDKGEVLREKRPYILHTSGDAKDEADGTLSFVGENYPTFPIVPLWGNMYRQSELVGLRESIDAYDLIKSGFANTVDEASLVYWTISNAGGMDDEDLVKFVEHMKTVKAAVVEDDGANAQSHVLEAPYASREAILSRLEKDLYRDAMAVNTDEIAAGQVTATQIMAAYDAHNSKVDQYETNVIEFLTGILRVAGLEDEPSFTRSQIMNTTEQIQNVLLAASYLGEEYVTTKVLQLLGDGDRAEEVLRRQAADGYQRITPEPEEDEGGAVE